MDVIEVRIDKGVKDTLWKIQLKKINEDRKRYNEMLMKENSTYKIRVKQSGIRIECLDCGTKTVVEEIKEEFKKYETSKCSEDICFMCNSINTKTYMGVILEDSDGNIINKENYNEWYKENGVPDEEKEGKIILQVNYIEDEENL